MAALAPARPLKVVLVDDAEELRFLVRFALEQTGEFTVLAEAADGQAGIDAVAEHQPDLVLLDVSMPGIDGLEALPHIRAAAPGARVVMLSAFEQRRLGQFAVQQGATAYLEKGLPPNDLVVALREAMGTVPPGLLDDRDVAELSGEELLAVVAHDLRGPITALIGFGETLGRSWDALPESTRRDMVARMTAQAGAMATITENLLASHAAGVGGFDVATERVDLERLLPAIVDDLRPLAPRHDVRLAVVPGLPEVAADPARLRQVLANLVTNASRFGPLGSVIVVMAEPAEGGIVLSVSDEGPGIPAGARHQVFEKHVRLGPGRGLGLGLFVSANLVRAMGGTIWVADEPGGARLCVRLRAAS